MNKSETVSNEPAAATAPDLAQPEGERVAEAVTIDLNDRRERRRERRAERAARDPLVLLPASDADGEAATEPRDNVDRVERRATLRSAPSRPRAPRAERAAQAAAAAESAVIDAAVANAGTLEPGQEIPGADDPDLAPPPILVSSGKGKKSASRAATRLTRKQQAAAAAVEATEDNPALGALNRHLNLLLQQLAAAHRVIGRVAAERDALRQQLADLQGIPVEEIVVTSIGAATSDVQAKPTPTGSASSTDGQKKSLAARLNYFGGEDYATMKRRRQGFALVLLLICIAIWIGVKMGMVSIPDDLSRESLGDIAFIGDFMTIFLAGWLFFRVIRVSSKGVKWVFPSEDQRRRRR